MQTSLAVYPPGFRLRTPGGEFSGIARDPASLNAGRAVNSAGKAVTGV